MNHEGMSQIMNAWSCSSCFGLETSVSKDLNQQLFEHYIGVSARPTVVPVPEQTGRHFCRRACLLASVEIRGTIFLMLQ